MKNINIYQKITVAYVLGVIGLWVVVQLAGAKPHDTNPNYTLNYWYSFLFGLTPLFAGIIGIVQSKIWGSLKSTLGRAIFFISLGLVLWGLGETVWSYYNFFKHIPAPYPSAADIGFAPSVFFWVIGAAYLAHASGAWLTLKRSHRAKAFTAIAVAAITGLSYWLLIRVARGNVIVPEGESILKAVLDIAYPLGDFLAATFAFIVFTLSFRYLGGLYRAAIGSTLLGLATMYVADFIFSYTTTTGSYYNGNWGDLLLCVGLFLLSFGVLGFATKPNLASHNEETEA